MSRRQISAALVEAVTWLIAWFGYGRAGEVARQYRAAYAAYPLLFGDLARYCSAFDDTFDDESARLSDVTQGKRRVWLHIQGVLKLNAEDLRKLETKTEYHDDD